MNDVDAHYYEDIELAREIEIGRHTPTRDEIVDFATAESFMDDVSVIPSVRRRRSCSPARKKD